MKKFFPIIRVFKHPYRFAIRKLFQAEVHNVGGSKNVDIQIGFTDHYKRTAMRVSR